MRLPEQVVDFGGPHKFDFLTLLETKHREQHHDCGHYMLPWQRKLQKSPKDLGLANHLSLPPERRKKLLGSVRGPGSGGCGSVHLHLDVVHRVEAQSRHLFLGLNLNQATKCGLFGFNLRILIDDRQMCLLLILLRALLPPVADLLAFATAGYNLFEFLDYQRGGHGTFRVEGL